MTRRQSNNQWGGGIAAHPPQKFPSAKTRWKNSRLEFFGDQDGILLTDYLPKGRTINTEYYLFLLVQSKDILKEQRHGAGSLPRGSYSCTTMTLHRALATQKKLAYLGFQFLDHPPYSPYLAPSDYHLFPGLKKQLKGRHFSSEAEVIAAAETWLDGQTSDFFFLSGLQKLEQGNKKFIELRGEYVEKIPSLVAVACSFSCRAKDLSGPPRS